MLYELCSRLSTGSRAARWKVSPVSIEKDEATLTSSRAVRPAVLRGHSAPVKARAGRGGVGCLHLSRVWILPTPAASVPVQLSSLR